MYPPPPLSNIGDEPPKALFTYGSLQLPTHTHRAPEVEFTYDPPMPLEKTEGPPLSWMVYGPTPPWLNGAELPRNEAGYQPQPTWTSGNGPPAGWFRNSLSVKSGNIPPGRWFRYENPYLWPPKQTPIGEKNERAAPLSGIISGVQQRDSGTWTSQGDLLLRRAEAG